MTISLSLLITFFENTCFHEKCKKQVSLRCPYEQTIKKNNWTKVLTIFHGAFVRRVFHLPDCVFYTWVEFYMPLLLWFENSKLFPFPWGVILFEIKTFFYVSELSTCRYLSFIPLCVHLSLHSEFKKKLKTNRDKSLSIFSTFSTEISLKITHIHQLWSSLLVPVHPPSVRIGTSG